MVADSLVLIPADEAEKITDQALTRLSEESGLFFERTDKKGKTRTADLAPGILGAKWREALPADAEGWITVQEDERILELRLALQGPDMVRPEEALWVLFDGRMPPEAQVIRRRMLPAQSGVAVVR